MRRAIGLIFAVGWTVYMSGVPVLAEEGWTASDSQRDAGSATPTGAPLSGEAPSPSPQKEPTPEEMQKLMGAWMLPMADMMGLMLERMADTMAKPVIAENFATFSRNYYKALIARGFTEEEALKIVTASGLPGMVNKQ